MYEKEGKRYYFGYRRDVPKPDERRLTATSEQVAALPPSYILKDVTPVENQEQLESCPANAADNASKIRAVIVTGKYFNGSRLATYYEARRHDGT
jgi:hypothetical protein